MAKPIRTVLSTPEAQREARRGSRAGCGRANSRSTAHDLKPPAKRGARLARLEEKWTVGPVRRASG
jgi:hypothetical protein